MIHEELPHRLDFFHLGPVKIRPLRLFFRNVHGVQIEKKLQNLDL